MAMVGMIAVIAGGFLFLLFKAPATVPAETRLVDFPAELAAGTLPKSYFPNSGDSADAGGGDASGEKVNLEGEFETFDGKPGTTVATWPNFRGANHDNIVKSEVPLAESWPEGGPPKLWEIDLGEGYAGPTVWKGCVYLIDYDEEKGGDALRCFSFADGKEIWRRSYLAQTKANHGVSRTVPAVTEDFIVTMGPRCHVVCVSRETGDFRWGIDLVAEYGATVPKWYTGQCPLIDGTMAVLAPAGKSLLIGVDCETGNVLWETPNPDGWKMAHASVVKMTLLGKETYVYTADGGMVGVSAAEGDRGTILWKTDAWTNAGLWPSPVPIDESRIFLTGGFGAGSMMMGLKEEGGKIVPEPLYTLEPKVFSCEQQTPIFYKDHLFAILPKSGQAYRLQFACMNTDGEVIWASGTDRFVQGLGPFLLANDLFYMLDDHGKLKMARASLTGYEPLAEAQVLHGHDAWGPMALVDGKLILRDSLKMICLDVSAH